MNLSKRYVWIDNIKVFACFLVAVGHFLQSMVASGIINQSAWYAWFIQTVYYFHVPLFFVCSGFLYQKNSTINNLEKWKANAKKKILSLGIPYLTFSLITWGLKSIFSGSVNTEVNNLFYDLIVHPLSPYWYLYALFFTFLFVPTFTKKSYYLIFMGAAVFLKVFCEIDMYSVLIVVENFVWFLLGMGICLFAYDEKMQRYPKFTGNILLILFLMGSIATWLYAVESAVISLVLGMTACLGITIISIQNRSKLGCLSRYTMPVYLMHTIFAAGVRAVLFKLGVDSVAAHFVLGLVASFMGPIIAAEIMKKTKLDFFMDPQKYIRTTNI